MQVSRKSRICTSKLPSPDRPIDDQSPLTWYYSTSTALYESYNWIARRRKAMKFAPAKKFHGIWCPKRSPASRFHEIFENPTFHARPSPEVSSRFYRSFVASGWSIPPLGCIRIIKITGCRKEFAHFEKIDDERPKNTITMPANRSQNHPRRGITLHAKRCTNHVID